MKKYTLLAFVILTAGSAFCQNLWGIYGAAGAGKSLVQYGVGIYMRSHAVVSVRPEFEIMKYDISTKFWSNDLVLNPQLLFILNLKPVPSLNLMSGVMFNPYFGGGFRFAADYRRNRLTAGLGMDILSIYYDEYYTVENIHVGKLYFSYLLSDPLRTKKAFGESKERNRAEREALKIAPRKPLYAVFISSQVGGFFAYESSEQFSFWHSIGMYKHFHRIFSAEIQGELSLINVRGYTWTKRYVSLLYMRSLAFRFKYFSIKAGAFAELMIPVTDDLKIKYSLPGIQLALGSGRKFFSKRLKPDIFLRFGYPSLAAGIGIKLAYTFNLPK